MGIRGVWSLENVELKKPVDDWVEIPNVFVEPPTANTGYFLTGGPSGQSKSDVDKIAYSTNTTARVPSANMATGRNYIVGGGSKTIGYCIGGFNGSTTFSLIEKITYATDTSATVSSPAGAPRQQHGVAGNADNYIKRREQEILEDGNLSELQQRLKESSLALEVGMGYLTEWFLLLKNQFPIVANGLIESAKKINVLHFLFKITFTVDTSNLNKEMMFYNDRGITPWISFTTLEEMMPSTSKELSNALNREFNQFDKISKNAKAPFIVGLRTWLIGSNDEFDLFFKHVQQLLELPNVEHVIADWEGAQNQKLVFKIYKHLPDESKPRFGWTLRALDATNSYLNQTVDVMK